MTSETDHKRSDVSILSQPFDVLAAHLRFLSGQEPRSDAVAALVSCWFAVIRECFDEGRSEANRANFLCKQHRLDDLEPFSAALCSIVKAFSGHEGPAIGTLRAIETLRANEALRAIQPVNESPHDEANDLLMLESVLETPNWFTFFDLYDEAGSLSDHLLQQARLRNDFGSEILALGCHIELDLRRGRWNQCGEMLRAAFHVSRNLGVPTGYLDVLAARLAACQGDAHNLEAHLRSARKFAYDRGDTSTLWRADAAEALAAFGNEDFELAESLLRPLASRQCPAGGHLAAVRQWDGDLIEALVLLGKIDEARQTVDQLSSRFASPWALAIEARCQALTVENTDDAWAYAVKSIEGFERIGATFEQSRSEVVASGLARKVGDIPVARSLARHANATFEALGAIPWAQRSARLFQPFANTPNEEPVLLNQLTAQEREIVFTLSAGRSNREISQQLFISVKTVESHLTHIYQKFGVASRTQLIAGLHKKTEFTPQIKGNPRCIAGVNPSQ